jgi:hypothetical protein
MLQLKLAELVLVGIVMVVLGCFVISQVKWLSDGLFSSWSLDRERVWLGAMGLGVSLVALGIWVLYLVSRKLAF